MFELLISLLCPVSCVSYSTHPILCQTTRCCGNHTGESVTHIDVVGDSNESFVSMRLNSCLVLLSGRHVACAPLNYLLKSCVYSSVCVHACEPACLPACSRVGRVLGIGEAFRWPGHRGPRNGWVHEKGVPVLMPLSWPGWIGTVWMECIFLSGNRLFRSTACNYLVSSLYSTAFLNCA